MLLGFVPPWHAEKQAVEYRQWCSEWIKALRGWEEGVLTAAVDQVSRSRKARSFPMLGEFVAACEDVAPDVRRTDTEQLPAAETEPPYHRKAAAAMHSDWGQTALRQGWAPDLYVRVLHGGRIDMTDPKADRFRAQRHAALAVFRKMEVARRVRRPCRYTTSDGVEVELVPGRYLDACASIGMAMAAKGTEFREKYLRDYSPGLEPYEDPGMQLDQAIEMEVAAIAAETQEEGETA